MFVYKGDIRLLFIIFKRYRHQNKWRPNQQSQHCSNLPKLQPSLEVKKLCLASLLQLKLKLLFITDSTASLLAHGMKVNAVITQLLQLRELALLLLNLLMVPTPQSLPSAELNQLFRTNSCVSSLCHKKLPSAQHMPCNRLLKLKQFRCIHGINRCQTHLPISGIASME